MGLFSNIFLMDFINRCKDIPNKLFKLYSIPIQKDVSTIGLVRGVKILDDKGEVVEKGREILINDKVDADDYSLIAKIEYKGKKIFIIGGVRSQGTEFAALKLK